MNIPGVVVTQLERFEDQRGHFSEVARAADVPAPMVQASHSHSRKGVLRGLHFHREQADLWYLASGRSQIALVDLRTRDRSPTVEVWTAESVRPETVFIPPGVAHGYLALSDIDMLYWTSKEWDPDDEQGVAWNDPTFSIPWETNDPFLSDRDKANPPFAWHDIPAF